MPRCKECGGVPGAANGVHQPGCGRHLDREADRLLVADRKARCDCISCRREAMIDRQWERSSGRHEVLRGL